MHRWHQREAGALLQLPIRQLAQSADKAFRGFVAHQLGETKPENRADSLANRFSHRTMATTFLGRDVFHSVPTNSSFTPANKELDDVSDSCPPVCPLHKKSMICVEPIADTHYKCREYECPIYWNPTTSLYYLKSRADGRLEGRPN
jgi:hypothetical protein